MFSEYKVTEIYCMTDDFCKEFVLQQRKYMIENKQAKHRNKPNRMSDVEIMVILILLHSGGFRYFKHYYKEHVCKHLKHLFPQCVSHNRFVEREKSNLIISAGSGKNVTSSQRATMKNMRSQINKGTFFENT